MWFCKFHPFPNAKTKFVANQPLNSDGRSIVVMLDQINYSYGGNIEIHFLYSLLILVGLLSF